MKSFLDALAIIYKGVDALGKAEKEVGIRVRRPGPKSIGNVKFYWEGRELCWKLNDKPHTAGSRVHDWGSRSLLDELLPGYVRSRPRLALRYLRELQALGAWINARCDGLKRHQAEIARQQVRWKEMFDAEEAVASLGGA